MPTMPIETPTLHLLPAAQTEATSTARHTSDDPLEVLRDELLAIPARDLLPLNVDVAAAALLVLGVQPRLRELRAGLVALFGEARVSELDRLEVLAWAAMQAQAALTAAAKGDDVPELSKQLLEHRAVLLAEVRSLIARNLLSPHRLKQLPGTNGYKNQCAEMLQLTVILGDAWDEISDKTGLTRAEVHRGEAIAIALMTAVGVRDHASQSEAAALRQRAFTLLARTYDQARRLISCLRWSEGDADEIAPSLLGRRRGRRRRDKPESPDVVSPTPA
ncbi:MAG: hypothetical protein J0L92_29730 [Deltaproteobacteria bacterium]|nr:hypothetical protein [Deltaproteobacteria bacterium]